MLIYILSIKNAAIGEVLSRFSNLI